MQKLYMGGRVRIQWWWIIVALWAGILGLDPILKFYDENLRPQPWLTAEIEIQPTPDGRPRIMYAVEARVDVRGEWKAWLTSDGGFRLCDGGTGRGTYSDSSEGPRSWAWADWLGRDCAVPNIPFRACVFYDVQTPHGARGHFGPFCSPLFDPRKG